MRPSIRSFARRSVLAGLCTLAPLLVSGHAQAQSAMPEMKSAGAAKYVCGGIGSDESTAMRAAMKDHPLALLFARADGAYLADVAVDLTPEKGGAPIALRATGPVCLVDLPAGRYAVEAKVEGMTKKQDVSVGGGPKSVDFRF